MTADLEASYRACRECTRRAASNFYWAIRSLPGPKRDAMQALYAFARRTDDLGDCDEPADERRRALSDWRQAVHEALRGHAVDPLLPALADTARRYDIPPTYFDDVIDGVTMDLVPCRYETFADLQQYCYRVASVVGLACIRIWGFQGRQAIERATECGLAFQLTNILRDLQEDSRRNRIYLPLDELRQFHYPPDALLAGVVNGRFRELMRFQLDRAEALYQRSAALSDHLDPDGRRVFGLMHRTYHGLLQEIRRRDGDVFSQPVRLGRRRKLAIAVSQLIGRRLAPAGRAG